MNDESQYNPNQPKEHPMTELSAEAAVAAIAAQTEARPNAGVPTPVTVDFGQLSSAQIQALISEGQSHLQKNAAQLRRGARESTAAHAKSLGYTIEDLFPSRGSEGAIARIPGQKGKAGVYPPKYANPANPSETWAGRGKRPGWFSTHVGGGGKAEDLLIK